MRDFGFGVLQTAPLRSSSPGPLFCGEAYGPYAVGSVNPLPSATPFGPLSPPPLPVTGFLEAASPFSVPLGGGAGSPAAAASSSSPFLAHQQTMQDELLLGLTQQPARPLSGAAATEKLPDHHPGGGTIAGVTHLLPSQDFKPSLHHPSSSSASSCCCCRTSSPQDFSKRQQQQLSSQKRKEFSPPHLPHPPDSKPPPPPPPLHCPGRFSPPPPPAGPLLQPAQLAQRQQQQPPQQFSLLHQQHLSPQDFAPRQRPADLPPLPQLPPSPPAAPRRRHGGAGSPRKTPAAGEGSAAESPNAGLASSTPVNPAPGSMESPNHPLLNSPSNLLPGGALGAGAFSSLQSPDLPHPGGGGGGGGGGPPGGGGGGGSASPPPLPGFGTPWSVQTASPPPQPQQPPPTQPQQQPPPPQQPPQPQPQPPGSSATTPGGGSGGSLSAMPPPSPDSENGFYPGLPSSMNPAFFPSFSPVSPHGCTGLSVPTSGGGGGGFGGPFSATAVPPPPPPAMNIPQQQPPPPAAPQQPQSRRSPVSPQLQQQHQAAAAAFLQQRNSYNHHQPLLKQSPWSNHQSSGWGTGSMSWGAMHGRDHRRTGNMGIPGTMNQISPLKKPFSGNVIAPPKFTRSTPSLTPKSWIEDNVFRTDNNSNTLLPLQITEIVEGKMQKGGTTVHL
ncbi:cytoplasmic polyadenylation element-binding protein 2 isoform X4 [Homo sapiens]|uniref:cytoplasmic polyadenylation element-binding protein 2 isoform X4 n=1 Tax=Homo sapiens TaxID=9606 RepID=UPI0005D00BE9|nr:cytoplasmic polyadenylation element-binding protein 2 isoform X4 [Homo sapiens]XP_054204903.1 cytoplasmic polyadenylation element-binding protein 2 isoform X4 [Homo sapiens]|eukprot:XP_011512081.1 cytoplasmic polyadenylation element-binding protein 2 isoform X4 [Homo sapiens]